MNDGGDSLDLVEFLMELEKQFNVQIPDEAAARLDRDATLGEVWRVLSGTKAVNALPSARDPLWIRLRIMYARAFDVAVDDVDPTSRLGGA